MKRRSCGAVQLFGLAAMGGSGPCVAGAAIGTGAVDGTCSGRRSVGADEAGAATAIGRGVTTELGNGAERVIGDASTVDGGEAGLTGAPGAAVSGRGRPAWWGRP